MATRTLGTTANNSLTAMLFAPGGMAPADVASISQGVKNDGGGPDIRGSIGPIGAIVPGAWDSGNGYGLIVPNRGILRVFPGDYVAIDSQGWPILVSANSIANAAWTHS
jgi:hypothetical protein